jgi:hypothetical protein
MCRLTAQMDERASATRMLGIVDGPGRIPQKAPS